MYPHVRQFEERPTRWQEPRRPFTRIRRLGGALGLVR